VVAVEHVHRASVLARLLVQPAQKVHNGCEKGVCGGHSCELKACAGGVGASIKQTNVERVLHQARIEYEAHIYIE
jgi:hypothetical protein